MENLIIKPTAYTPEIMFDGKNNILEIKGESFMENSTDFYAPVISWLEKYIAFNSQSKQKRQQIKMNIYLVYFNTSSTKLLMEIFEMLKAAEKNGCNIIINWVYDEDDEDSLEFGEIFQEDFGSKNFRLVVKE